MIDDLKLFVAAFSVWLLSGLTSPVSADEFRVEVISEAAPEDALSPEVAETLAPKGIRVVRGEKRTIAEFWFCQEWPVEGDFSATAEVLYPFRSGQLIGVMRLRRRGNDFRDQQIDRGVYTLRYSQQPIDGNHVGTSPTRDFLLLMRAEEDESTAPVDSEALNEASADAAQSSHPAMLCLQAAQAGGAGELPALRHDAARDWWVLQIAGTAQQDAGPRQLPVDLVVVGYAQE